MSDPTSTPDTHAELLAQFEAEYFAEANVDDQAERVRVWKAAQPGLAADIDRLVQMWQQFGRPSVPEELPDFDVFECLGRGGMGVVHRAQQRSLNRVVALKFLHGPVSSEREVRFLNEQRVLAKLHQTNIVPVHTAGRDGPWLYFAMAHIDGASLNQVVQTAWNHETAPGHGKMPTLAELTGTAIRRSRQAAQTVTRRSHPAAEANGIVPPVTAVPADAIKPDPAFFRSMARGLANVAEALHHAHEADIFHRDIKPGNVLVDRAGKFWLIDFGLARHLKPAAGEASDAPPPDLLSVLTRNLAGTPQYMAPEQFAARADERSDVWGLGVTLYEVLTLRRAFDGPTVEAIRRRVCAEEPAPLEALARNIPADLRAICRKAIRKEPGQRYATTQVMADDLRHWLHGEPTQARPAWPPRRTWLWAKRNKGWATALLTWFCCAIGLAVAMVTIERNAANAATELAESQRRDVLIQQLQRMRLTNHETGWMDNAWDLVREAVKIRKDATIRDLAAGSLIGLDARISKRFEKHDTAALAWDATGKKLLVASSFASPDQPGGPAFLWDSTTDQRIVSQQRGPGPVAFRADGTPLQLVVNPKDAAALMLWDVSGQRPLQAFRLPMPDDVKKDAKPKYHGLSLAPDGKYVAATAKMPDGKPLTAIWDADTGQLLHQMPEAPTELVFNPAAGNKPRLFAAGYEDGRVTVHSLPKGAQVAAFRPGRHKINALAFGRKVRRSADEAAERAELRGWLVAVGDAGAHVSVWNLATQDRLSNCYGSATEVFTVAFSPDGVTLASAGRGRNNLWDVTTGRLLLQMKEANYTLALAFAPDGKKLSVAHYAAFGSPGGVTVWELADGRGIQSLRGLAGMLSRIQFSPNGQLIAAQADSWDVAIWERQSGRLLHVLEVPRGLHADNANFAFNADASRFVFSAGEHATMWNVATGEQLAQWKLPPGLGDKVVFHPSGQFLLCRWETEDMKNFPIDGLAPPKANPRVCRGRNLSGPKPTEPIWKTDAFRRHVYGSCIAPDGSFYVVDGMGGPTGKERTIRAFDPLTGAEIWSLPSQSGDYDGAGLYFSPDSRVLWLTLDARRPQSQFVEPRTGKLLDTPHPQANYPAPKGTYRTHDDGVYRWDGNQLLFNPEIGLWFNAAGTHGVGSVGNHAAVTRSVGSSPDGTVLVYDMQEVQKRLAAEGLGW